MAARLLFIGMWNFADDCGRLALSPKTLKAQIMPSDDITGENILGMLKELSSNGLILAYEVDGRKYIQITGWQHQRIDKPQPGKHPAPKNGYSAIILGMVVDGREGKVEEGNVSDRIPDVVDDDERARPPLISPEANKLADECAKIAGHDLAFIPPSWYGAAYRAQTWLNEGWPEEIILLSVREQSARKRDGPPSKIDYFEKGIASAIARANAPLPVATITEIPRNRHAADQSKSGYAAIDRVFDRPEMRPAIGQAADENTVLSLPAGSIQRS
jgi:hypothetical protein